MIKKVIVDKIRSETRVCSSLTDDDIITAYDRFMAHPTLKSYKHDFLPLLAGGKEILRMHL